MARKFALITGVSRREGLGFAVAQALADHELDVVLTAREGAAAQALADEIGEQATALPLDVTSDTSTQACVADLERRDTPLDALINNAAGGFDLHQSVLDADLDLARLALEVNVLGPWRTSQALLPLLKRSPAARIVNVSAEAGSLTSSHGLTHPAIDGLIPGYSISKSALNALTIKLAHALRDTTILVNAVCPGETATHPELGDEDDARSAAESAHGVIWAATLPAGGPTGRFFRDAQLLSW
jgi:NAD(P)-dependent dehydrogenase (short-subunit alcohol dehydrogenase family)